MFGSSHERLFVIVPIATNDPENGVSGGKKPPPTPQQFQERRLQHGPLDLVAQTEVRQWWHRPHQHFHLKAMSGEWNVKRNSWKCHKMWAKMQEKKKKTKNK